MKQKKKKGKKEEKDTDNEKKENFVDKMEAFRVIDGATGNITAEK